MSDCCYSEVISIQRPACVTPTPTPTSTPTSTPTETPTSTPTQTPNTAVCCFCDYAIPWDGLDDKPIGSFTFHGQGISDTQAWTFLVQNCGVDNEVLLFAQTFMDIFCDGVQYRVQWNDSGNTNSLGGIIYDATIAQKD
jgi:hypothetical protein